ncbi:hypothetical protein BK022_24450, partial [Methylorubrum extorquens]
MRVWILSDLHTDFEAFAWPAPPEHDVLVVAGDVCERLPRALRWLRETAPTDRPIVYTPGNHDAWRMRWPRDLAAAHEEARMLGIELLASGEETMLAGARFIGATLWTDFRIAPASEGAARAEYNHGGLRDHQRITSTLAGHCRRWLARDAADLHVQHRARIERALSDRYRGGPTVVVTHHAPRAAEPASWPDGRPVRRRLCLGPDAPDARVRGARTLDPRAHAFEPGLPARH